MMMESGIQTAPAESTKVIRADGPMAQGYRVMLSANVITTLLLAFSIMAVAFGLVGRIGFYLVHNPLERVAYSLVFAFLCFPVNYGVVALAYYFLRFRSPLEVLGVQTLLAFFLSFQCTAVIGTVEALTRSGPPEVGFLDTYVKVTSASLVGTLFCFYLVWQRTRHAAGGPVTERDTPETALDGLEYAARAEAGTTRAEPAKGTGDGAAPARTDDQKDAAKAQDEPADAPVRSNGDLPIRGMPEWARPAPAAPVPVPASTTSTPATRGTIIKLLPNRLGTDLVYIKSEDHYLEVHTTTGSSLIKMRFSDAVAELADHGMQVHRSYWVATKHVVRTGRNGKRTTLRLTGDHEVPVSVTYLRGVRAILAE
jgi:hypothetical protein